MRFVYSVYHTLEAIVDFLPMLLPFCAHCAVNFVRDFFVYILFPICKCAPNACAQARDTV